jgi:hypothetical protein
VRGQGFSFELPAGWAVTKPRGAVVGRSGSSLVSVTPFPLLKKYEEAKFGAAAKELDALATRLAKRAGATLSQSETVTVAERKTRAYRYGDRRIGFVLVDRREYQLFCVRATAACDLLFATFTLA